MYTTYSLDCKSSLCSRLNDKTNLVQPLKQKGKTFRAVNFYSFNYHFAILETQVADQEIKN